MIFLFTSGASTPLRLVPSIVKVDDMQQKDISKLDYCERFGMVQTVAVLAGVRDPFRKIEPTFEVFSGVIISHNDDQFLLTAAHCVDVLRSYVTKGLEIIGINISWFDDDVEAQRDNGRATIPNFVSNPEHVLFRKFDARLGWDFAVISFDDVTKTRLASSVLKPIPIAQCVRPEMNYGTYAICGFPNSVNKTVSEGRDRTTNPTLMTTYVHIPLQRTQIPSDPVGPPIQEDPRFIVEVPQKTAKEMQMKGMSGGLMFGCFVEDRSIGCFPIAIQAKWWHEKYAAGNYLTDIAADLVDIL